MRWGDTSGTRRVPLGLLVMLLHLGVAGLLAHRADSPRPVAPRWISLQLWPEASPRPAAPPAAPRREAPSKTSRVSPPAVPQVASRPVPQTSAEPALATTPDPIYVQALPASAASAPSEPLLLNTAATRRAVRMMARDPLLSERAQAATGLDPRESQSARLSREMQQAGYGDCTKGEFFGGGAGLLSLPFYLVAQARGACAK